MKIRALDAEQRKIFINSCQVYQEFMNELKASKRFNGGMRWKQTGNKFYLFKTRGGKGMGKSLGLKSPETEKIFHHFHAGKTLSKERLSSLKQSLIRQSKLSVAIGINRVPKVPAQIIRLLDQEGLLGHGITILGTHSIYAYEAAAGVVVSNDLMETFDIDLLYGVQHKLKLSNALEVNGLIGLLQKVDKSFRVAQAGHYRAVNDRGFMVELIKKPPEPPFKMESQVISKYKDDLKAAEIEGLKWLNSAPLFRKTAIAEDGMPVDLVVPDPRYFALNKLWISSKEDRDPIKKPRDFQQAKVIATIAINYLGLSFNDDFLRVFPESIRKRLPELIDDSQDSKSLDMLFS